MARGPRPPRGPPGPPHGGQCGGDLLPHLASPGPGVLTCTCLHLDQANVSGWTPLMYAAYLGHCSLVTALLGEGRYLHRHLACTWPTSAPAPAPGTCSVHASGVHLHPHQVQCGADGPPGPEPAHPGGHVRPPGGAADHPQARARRPAPPPGAGQEERRRREEHTNLHPGRPQEPHPPGPRCQLGPGVVGCGRVWLGEVCCGLLWSVVVSCGWVRSGGTGEVG